uniref:Si:dkey-42i9.7 n=1 Tax=Cyprinus carpio TaxID=7962 RepID=A0A8C1Y8H1_CYPCA
VWSFVKCVAFLLFFCLVLGDDCKSYYTSNNQYKFGITCYGQHCCGTCDYRYCCLSENHIFIFWVNCFINGDYTLFRAVAGAHVTTVTNAHFIQQQPVMQGGQCPQYQPVLTQPGYGQPMQMGPYQGQPYAPGPPPSYHVASQAMYPMQPPAQPGVACMPSETSNQPAYNPAYVQPPNFGY